MSVRHPCDIHTHTNTHTYTYSHSWPPSLPLSLLPCLASVIDLPVRVVTLLLLLLLLILLLLWTYLGDAGLRCKAWTRSNAMISRTPRAVGDWVVAGGKGGGRDAQQSQAIQTVLISSTTDSCGYALLVRHLLVVLCHCCQPSPSIRASRLACSEDATR